MSYYKNPNTSEVYWYDADQTPLVGLVAMTQEEIDLHTNPPKTEEQLREEWKAERAALVAAITVTTQAGNTFDGDETSQGRMARAVIALNASPVGTKVNWILADNSVIQASPEELIEALALAGAAQAAIWVVPTEQVAP